MLTDSHMYTQTDRNKYCSRNSHSEVETDTFMNKSQRQSYTVTYTQRYKHGHNHIENNTDTPKRTQVETDIETST